MDDDSGFTEDFFSYFNAKLDLDASRQENEAIDALIKTRLYANAEDPPLYYTGPNDLVRLKQDVNYPRLQNQLIFIIDTIKNWGAQQEIPNLNSLNDFSERLTDSNSAKICDFYKDDKKQLEAFAVLLKDDEIDLSLRKKILNHLLADEGLAQCIDNCYLLISNAKSQLISVKNSKNNLYYLVRNYVSELARETAASRPYGLPKSYKETLCDLKKLPILAYESHAESHFLMYARDKRFPVNAPSDVIGLTMGNTPNHEVLDSEYIMALKKRFTVDELLNHISQQYRKEFITIFSNEAIVYPEKIVFVNNKLDLLSQDDTFSLHDILEANGELKVASTLKQTLLSRLINRRWIKKSDKTVISLDSKQYHHFSFQNNIEINFLQWTNGKNHVVSCNFLNLINTDKAVNLDETTRLRLIRRIFHNLFIHSRINTIKSLSTIVDKIGFRFVDKYISFVELIEQIKTSTEVELVADLFKKLPKAKVNEVMQRLSVIDKNSLLGKGIIKANAITRYPSFSINYLIENSNEEVKDDILKVTKYFISSFLSTNHNSHDFSNLYFPRLAAGYLDNLQILQSDFSGCNVDQTIRNTVFYKSDLRNTQFCQHLSSCRFDYSLLEGTSFYKELADISFIDSDLRKTVFLGSGSFVHYKISLIRARLSTNAFQRLLDFKIHDFSYADLREVKFHEVRRSWEDKLDFSYADLDSVDLNGLDLRKIKLFGSNLNGANLEDAQFRRYNLDESIAVVGARLTFEAALDFYKVGVRDFNHCTISSRFIYLDDSIAVFSDVNFKQTQFIGHFLSIDITNCDLSGAQFLSPFFETEKYAHLNGIRFENTKLLNTEFHRIKFGEELSFSACVIEKLVLDNVYIPTEIMFTLYKLGHRDFTGIKGLLKDDIFKKLPPFPLSEASLSKEAFVDLYRQGVRDFRASNLNSFYLSGILTAQAISEIELKLEGAHYKQSLLSCSPRINRRVLRAEKIDVPCVFYILFKKGDVQTEKRISLAEIRELAMELTDETRIIFKEVVLGPKPISLLSYPDEINFYWDYEPDDEAMSMAIHFVMQSTKRAERRRAEINFYFTSQFKSDNVIKALANYLNAYGFLRGQLNYFNAQSHVAAMDLQTKPLSGFQQKDLVAKLPSILRRTEPDSSEERDRRTRRIKLQHMSTQMKERVQGGLRAGVKQGAQYDLGYALIHFVNAGVMHANAGEVKEIDANTKAALKRYARLIVDEEADKKRASAYQRELIVEIADQCIDRGECFNETLVRADIISTLTILKTDLQVGKEVAWEKFKNFFSRIGEYLSEKFDRVKEAFQRTQNTNLEKSARIADWQPAFNFRVGSRREIANSFILSKNDNTDQSNPWIQGANRPIFIPPKLGPLKKFYRRDIVSTAASVHNSNVTSNFLSLSVNETSDFNELLRRQLRYANLVKLVSKRKIYYWYEQPILIRFVKEIESVFSELVYDLSLDPNFSEVQLAGFLYSLWLELENYGVSSYSDPEVILQLFGEESFVQSFFNRTYVERADSFFNTTEVETTPLLADLDDLSETTETPSGNREKRSLLSVSENEKKSSYLGTMKAVTSAAPRPTGWLNTLAYTIKNFIFSIKHVIPVYGTSEAVCLGGTSLACGATKDFSTRYGFKPLLTFENTRNKEENNLLGLASELRPLDTINNGLILVDFSLRFVNSFFWSKPNKMGKNLRSDHALERIKPIV